MPTLRSVWIEAWSALPPQSHGALPPTGGKPSVHLLCDQDGDRCFPKLGIGKTVFPLLFADLAPGLRPAKDRKKFDEPVNSDGAGAVRRSLRSKADRLARMVVVYQELDHAMSGTGFGSEKRPVLMRKALQYVDAQHDHSPYDSALTWRAGQRVDPLKWVTASHEAARSNPKCSDVGAALADVELVNALESRLSELRDRRYWSTFRDDELIELLEKYLDVPTEERWSELVALDGFGAWAGDDSSWGLATTSHGDRPPPAVRATRPFARNSSSTAGALELDPPPLDWSVHARVWSTLKGQGESTLPSVQCLLAEEVERVLEPFGLDSELGRLVLLLGGMLSVFLDPERESEGSTVEDMGPVLGMGRSEYALANEINRRVQQRTGGARKACNRRQAAIDEVEQYATEPGINPLGRLLPEEVAQVRSVPAHFYMVELWKRVHGHEARRTLASDLVPDSASVVYLLTEIATTVVGRAWWRATANPGSVQGVGAAAGGPDEDVDGGSS